MADTSTLPWTEDQWAMLQRLVQDTARQARVASSFLELVGPLPPGQAFVPAQNLTSSGSPARLEINESETIPLVTIHCRVYLKTSEVNDPNLESARQMLTRAATVLARLEDQIIFNGIAQGTADRPDFNPRAETEFQVKPPIWQVTGPTTARRRGLLSYPEDGADDYGEIHRQFIPRYSATEAKWGGLVSAIAAAIQTLEGKGHYGPFACVLGQVLYLTAHSPTPNLVLASDRIIPFLGGGPFLRSAAIPDDFGVIVALSGAPVDLVVAQDMQISYLQVNEDAHHVFRVGEQIRLRIKEPSAIVRLEVAERQNEDVVLSQASPSA